jgi:Protein of unknown function (DUF3048) N-terminal domain/Protein of unknown function (DUF3048) C-terminal domain/Bacterial Ig-like domain
VSRGPFLAIGALIVLLIASAGGFLTYLSKQPTAVTLNLKDKQKDVPTDSLLMFKFSRAVDQKIFESALSISPTTPGTLTATSGQTEFTWKANQPLGDLTTYTISLKTFTDTTKHQIQGGHWTFTTIIEPKLTGITDPAGAPLGDASEVLPGTALTIKFNDAMEPATVSILNGTQPMALKWAADDRSATIATVGIPSGPLTLTLAPGAKDQTSHTVKIPWTIKTGLYFRDKEHATALRYPAIVQIPNDEFARDQDGLQAADIIFEYLAEGGITRLSAIYQNAPDLIGPMRSSRFISLKIARHYKGLLFQSGESQATAARAGSDPTPQFFDTVGYTFRTNARIAPDNLMIDGDGVNRAESLYDISAFTIPKARPDLNGGTSALTVNVDEHYSVYTYDPDMGTYQKNEEAHAYVDNHLGQPLRIEMLILLHTQETLLDVGDGHGSHIHDFNLDSGGAIEIFYKGLEYRGFWAAGDHNGPLTFTTADGKPVTLPPGLVFVDVIA